MLKLSDTQAGKKYTITGLMPLQSLSQRLAVLGLNTGVLIEILSLYKHGAVIKTQCGKIALGADILQAIKVEAV